MKQVVGTLTDKEHAELLSTPVVVGEGLVVGPQLTEGEWLAKYVDDRLPTTPEGWAERTREILGDDAPEVFDADS